MTKDAWRTDIEDLRARAQDVLTETTPQAIHARGVAQCMSGVIGLGARRYSLEAMQRACAELARHDRAWETTLGDLPRDVTGRVPEPVQMVAATIRGFYPLAGSEPLRAALAFWASERDPAVWMSIDQPAAA